MASALSGLFLSSRLASHKALFFRLQTGELPESPINISTNFANVLSIQHSLEEKSIAKINRWFVLGFPPIQIVENYAFNVLPGVGVGKRGIIALR